MKKNIRKPVSYTHLPRLTEIPYSMSGRQVSCRRRIHSVSYTHLQHDQDHLERSAFEEVFELVRIIQDVAAFHVVERNQLDRAVFDAAVGVGDAADDIQMCIRDSDDTGHTWGHCDRYAFGWPDDSWPEPRTASVSE